MYPLHQDKDIQQIKKILSEEFEKFCDWFVDNKLNIHLVNLFFLQVNGEQRASVSKILNMKT